ncbi:MAG TPA: hypothetical protein DCZ95_09975 [Verrucomicrobia bacterium]|nr:MAG: hypothetical protein A2X46_00195 [Lentisphaerae bacterium GWF2_57_35]HBA84408.1 hypothetical protein [Verrucomicrobiota bacterium]
MNRNQSTSPAAPQRVNEAAGLARALGVLLNIAQTYQTSHAVFQRALDERLPVFEIALKGLRDMTLYFSGGQIRYGALPLEPGLRMFQDMAQRLEKAGIQGLTFLPAVTAGELKTFFELLTQNADGIAQHGLQVLLEREGVRNIRDCKTRLGVVSDAKDKPADATRKPAKSFVAPGAATWEIEMDEEAGETPAAEATDDPHTHAFHGYVHQALSSLTMDQAAVAGVANSISAKFKEILTEQVETVRQEGERKARRLNTIKDMVLRELEAHQLAALVCDSRLNVMAANRLGRDLIGAVDKLEKGSALEQFIASGLERQVIELDGAPRVAHMILSVEPVSNDNVLLISIE